MSYKTSICDFSYIEISRAISAFVQTTTHTLHKDNIVKCTYKTSFRAFVRTTTHTLHKDNIVKCTYKTSFRDSAKCKLLLFDVLYIEI